MTRAAAIRFAVLGFLAFAMALGTVSTVARGAAFGTKPVAASIDAQHPIAQIVVSSLYAREEAFDVRVHRWSQTRGSEIVASDDASNFIVVPPIFSIAPYEEKVVRIGFRQLPSAPADEQSYQVVMTEVMRPGASAPRVISVPLFVQPASRAGTVTYAIQRTGTDGPALVIKNDSNIHIYIGKLSVSSDGKTVYDGKPDAYVLARTTRALPLRLAGPVIGTVAELSFETDDGSKHTARASVIQ